VRISWTKPSTAGSAGVIRCPPPTSTLRQFGIAAALTSVTSRKAAGLVDRVQVTLFPVITGQTGLDPIFQGAPDFDLELIEHRRRAVVGQQLAHGWFMPMTATPLSLRASNQVWQQGVGELTRRPQAPAAANCG
jgi:hypothetical protein